MKEVRLFGGQIALVDDEDYHRVSRHDWRIHSRGYAVSKIDGKLVLMHRFVLNAKPGQKVDRFSSNLLDNRRDNLEVRKSSTPMKVDSDLRSHNKSGFNGVCWHLGKQKWHAQITVDRKVIHLGWFDEADDAAREFDSAAFRYRGKRARLNFPDEVAA